MTTRTTYMEAAFSTSKYDAAMRHMKQTTQTTTSFLSSAWVKAAGSIYAAMRAWDMLKLGAKAEQQAMAFENMANSFGISGDRIIAKLREVSYGTIDTTTMIEKAGTAMMMGIRPDELVKLMEIARATSRLTGQTVTKAFEDISLAVGRQSRMILDNLGIIVKQGEANQDYARALGKTVKELTDVEKKQAFVNATIKAGNKLMRQLGNETVTTADKFAQLEASAKNAAQWLYKATVVNLAEKYADAVFAFNKIGEVLSGARHWNTGLLQGMEADIFNLKQAAQQYVNAAAMFNSASSGAGSGGGGDIGSPDTSYLNKILWYDASQITDMWLSFDQGRQDAHQRALEMIEQMDRAAYSQQQQDMLDNFTQQGQILQESYGAQELARWEHDERMKKLRQDYETGEIESTKKIVMMKLRSAQMVMSMGQQLASNLQSMTDKNNKALFYASKALAIGQAIVYTEMSAAMAAATPPTPNLPLAALARSVGYANVAAIAATTLTGGGGGSGAGGSGGGGGSANVNYPDVTPPPVTDPYENRGSLTVNINGPVIGNEQYIDDLIEKINDAKDDRNVTINYSTYAGDLT